MLPERPITRVETYLARLAGQDVAIPETPITRLECYLHYLCEHGGGGGGGDDATVYGFHINGADPDPETAVTYLRDAVGKTPAHMDYTTGAFDYGGWADAFFMPRPCMLRYDGTVAYYLDPDDYTKKADGTASDVGDPTFAGNAMMEWGQNGKRIWLKVVPDPGESSSGSVYIADSQVDVGYTAYPFINHSGQQVSHFYTPIYNGSSIVDGDITRMRSISGQAISSGLTGAEELVRCEANNPAGDSLWYSEVLADRILIEFLLILMGKSLNTQVIFGQGMTSGSEAALTAYITGALNDKGLFYGSNDTSTPVKVFGMENLWGLHWRRTAGLVLQDGMFLIKLTTGQQDGSTGNGYNSTGYGYIDTGISPSGTSGGYVDGVTFNEHGMFGKTISGSASTHLCDGEWFSDTGTRYALFGGSSNGGARCGAFACNLGVTVSGASWTFGASLSCKPKGA